MGQVLVKPQTTSLLWRQAIKVQPDTASQPTWKSIFKACSTRQLDSTELQNGGMVVLRSHPLMGTISHDNLAPLSLPCANCRTSCGIWAVRTSGSVLLLFLRLRLVVAEGRLLRRGQVQCSVLLWASRTLHCSLGDGVPGPCHWKKLSIVWLQCVVCPAKLLGLLLACPKLGTRCVRSCRISMSSVRTGGGMLDAFGFPFPGSVWEWEVLFISRFTSLTSLMVCLCLLSSTSFFFILSKCFWAWLANWVGVLEGTKYLEMDFHSPRPKCCTPYRNCLHLQVGW